MSAQKSSYSHTRRPRNSARGNPKRKVAPIRPNRVRSCEIFACVMLVIFLADCVYYKSTWKSFEKSLYHDLRWWWRIQWVHPSVFLTSNEAESVIFIYSKLVNFISKSRIRTLQRTRTLQRYKLDVFFMKFTWVCTKCCGFHNYLLGWHPRFDLYQCPTVMGRRNMVWILPNVRRCKLLTDILVHNCATIFGSCLLFSNSRSFFERFCIRRIFLQLHNNMHCIWIDRGLKIHRDRCLAASELHTCRIVLSMYIFSVAYGSSVVEKKKRRDLTLSS